MSDKEWYTNLSRYELEGKHVHVLFSDGTMEGSLNLLGQIVYWNSDAGLKHVQILDWNKDRTWTRATGVESVSMVWDERDWEQIDLENAGKDDVVVINGGLYLITDVRTVEDDSKPFLWIIGSNGCAVTYDMVSCALHSKHDFPTESGFYQSKSKETLYLSNDGGWWWFSEGWLFSMNQSPADLLPLTPVHFVDGKES